MPEGKTPNPAWSRIRKTVERKITPAIDLVIQRVCSSLDIFCLAGQAGNWLTIFLPILSIQRSSLQIESLSIVRELPNNPETKWQIEQSLEINDEEESLRLPPKIESSLGASSVKAYSLEIYCHLFAVQYLDT